MDKLYFGDNLDMLREKIKDELVDLVYLDPPFKSNANYNVLFKPGGVASEAQAEAFRDTWEWGDSARDAYDDVMKLDGDVALILSGLRRWLGESDGRPQTQSHCRRAPCLSRAADQGPGEVKDLRREASALKEVVAELTLENRLLKKGMTVDGEDAA